MIAVFHKIYLAIQATILMGGVVLSGRVVYFAIHDSETSVNARNCALQTISKNGVPLGAIESASERWTAFVRINVMFKGNLKAMKAEASRITNACSSYLLVDVADDSAQVSLFLVTRDGQYRAAYSIEEVLYGIGYVLGVTSLLSVLLFVIRKWIGIVFKSRNSV